MFIPIQGLPSFCSVSQVMVLASAGTIIGDMTTYGGGIAKAFDGNYAQAEDSGAGKASASSAFVGKDWGVGNTKTISGIKTWGSTTNGYVNSSATIGLYVYGSNSAPANPTDGTLIATINAALADVNNTNPQSKLTGFDTLTPYRYHWLAMVGSGSLYFFLGEMEFYENVCT